MSVFGPALATMTSSASRVFGPRSFQGYLQGHSLANKNTAQHIPIDSLGRLAKELQEARTMVFRLGSPDGERHTHFALACCVAGWEDYFLLDRALFSTSPAELFIPPVSMRQLFAFTLLPKFTETSLVNLAIASGLLSHALQLDEAVLSSAPATGQGTYSFAFSPHEALNAEWKHMKGQVEIDAVLTAKRQGTETLFVIEAKASEEFDSLAKHKLLYPVLALQTTVPRYMPVVPVYLRAISRADGLHFYVAECAISLGNGAPSVAGLKLKGTSHLVLHGFGRG
jgi:hypothetical protein